MSRSAGEAVAAAAGTGVTSAGAAAAGDAAAWRAQPITAARPSGPRLADRSTPCSRPLVCACCSALSAFRSRTRVWSQATRGLVLQTRREHPERELAALAVDTKSNASDVGNASRQPQHERPPPAQSPKGHPQASP